MNHNVYLPDEISERAKAASLNLSGLLRTAVTDELERLDELAAARDGMTEQNVDVDPDEGALLRLRFTGKCIGSAGYRLSEIYLTDEGKVIVTWEDGDYTVYDDVEEFTEWVNNPMRDNLGRDAEEALGNALAEVGGRVVIDL